MSAVGEFPLQYDQLLAQIARNADIIERHLNGERHPSIAESHGITRERVRQIIARNQEDSRTYANQKKWDAIIADAVERKLTAMEVAKEQNCGDNQVRYNAKSRKVTLPRVSISDLSALKRGAGFVLMGESIYRASFKAGVTQARLSSYLRKVGIKSRAISKWTYHPTGTASGGAA